MKSSANPICSPIGKRLVKRPKLYLRDSGILHTLLSLETEKALLGHPKLGSSWEGFALEAVLRSLRKTEEQVYFWATHSGAEVDLFWQHEGKNWACEFKYADAPRLTHSMRSALESLNLARLWIIYPGKDAYPLHAQIEVLPLQKVGVNWVYE